MASALLPAVFVPMEMLAAQEEEESGKGPAANGHFSPYGLEMPIPNDEDIGGSEVGEGNAMLKIVRLKNLHGHPTKPGNSQDCFATISM